ncbi:MAG: 16S rRNA (adenine(1518)-N(6)/adenine(1519)-N(6))-dimethyltransferase RsmA [Burkholderia sp.]|nr:16S rRNA (adenine(1518)-N(6)/adenine(1519)-N(6))-dimethyltransferase RsmA [Burkholderia sp.]
MLNNKKHEGHFARKRFGQNFLIDPIVVDLIISLIAPARGDRMVEIGPGLGALTEPLIARLATPESPLHAIELDRDLISRLQKKHFASLLDLYRSDALKFDFRALAEPGDQPSLRVVGDLPYNISSPILFHMMKFANIIIDQHFMLQNEVVERMIAKPGTKTFSRMSVMLQYRYAMEKLLSVQPESFCPLPKVDSAIVQMIPYRKNELLDIDISVLSDITTAAFSKRRKMLRNTLKDYRDIVDFDNLGFDLTRRAEDVSVSEYAHVAQMICRNIKSENKVSNR